MSNRITASQVKSMRSRLDATQVEFAALTGTSFVSVSKWEHEHCSPTGLCEVVLTLLQGAMRRAPISEIKRALQDCNGNTVDIVRVLVHLEGLKNR